MSDYISREAALSVNFKIPTSFFESKITTARKAVQEYANEIAKLPAADVRPVVLCRDCDCWNDWDSAGKESLGNYVCSCGHWTVEDGAVFYTRPTDFCSYGEKRE